MNESHVPNLLKKHGMKKTSQTVINHLVGKVMQSENATNSRDDLVFKVAEKWITLNRLWNTSDEELKTMVNQFGETATSTLHIYLLCSAIQDQVGTSNDNNCTLIVEYFYNLCTKLIKK